MKTTAFDLQMDPASPGLSLPQARPRAGQELLVRAGERATSGSSSTARPQSLLLAYVDHHDKAYGWAERRRIERHPTTGAMQIVGSASASRRSPRRSRPRPRRPRRSRSCSTSCASCDLMCFGVPEDWVEDVRRADEDTIFDVVKHLPPGGRRKPCSSSPSGSGSERAAARAGRRRPLRPPGRAAPLPRHARRRGAAARARRTLGQVGRLSPPRAEGSGGAGPSAGRRASRARPARARPWWRCTAPSTLPEPTRRRAVLLTTFTPGWRRRSAPAVLTLAGTEPAILSAHHCARRCPRSAADLFAERHRPRPASRPTTALRELLTDAAAASGQSFAPAFLLGEWTDVVDAWQLRSWEAYRDVSRLGRKTRIGGKQREVLWPVFARVRAGWPSAGS